MAKERNIRVSDELYTELRRIKKNLQEAHGRDVSLVQCSKLLAHDRKIKGIRIVKNGKRSFIERLFE